MGSTLALAYAEKHPKNVNQMVLVGVTTGRHSEFDWTFRGGLSKFFPEEWSRLVSAIPVSLKSLDTVEAYCSMLNDRDEGLRNSAAMSWCEWESTTPEWPPTGKLQKRFESQEFRLTYARLVTHYVSHNAWLEGKILLKDASSLAGIKGALINGRFDLQAPVENAYTLKRVWPDAYLNIIDDSGHAPTRMIENDIVEATDRFIEE